MTPANWIIIGVLICFLSAIKGQTDSSSTSTDSTTTTTSNPYCTQSQCTDLGTNAGGKTGYVYKIPSLQPNDTYYGVVFCILIDRSYNDGQTQLYWCPDGLLFTLFNNVPIVPYVPCFTTYYFSFTVGKTSYYLNNDAGSNQADGAIGNYDMSTWQFVTVANATDQRYQFLLARLPTGRDSTNYGQFYCSVKISASQALGPNWPETSAVWHAYYFESGSYYPIQTDALGNIVKSSDVEIHTYFYLAPIITTAEPGCTTPFCCWFQDKCPMASYLSYIFNTLEKSIPREQMWNGTHWTVRLYYLTYEVAYNTSAFTVNSYWMTFTNASYNVTFNNMNYGLINRVENFDFQIPCSSYPDSCFSTEHVISDGFAGDGLGINILMTSQWTTYSGDVSWAIMQTLHYFNTMTWHEDGKQYTFINGSVFQIDPTTGSVLGSTPIFKNANVYVSAQFLVHFDKDPLVIGGIHYASWGVPYFRNLTGDYSIKVVNGLYVYTRVPLTCTNRGLRNIYGTDTPSCSATSDAFPLSQFLPCDPKLVTKTNNPCGTGYKCQTLSYMTGLSCQKGLCVPDYKSICSPWALSLASTVPTNLRRYGSLCDANADCYTGICLRGYCSCSNCTRNLPTIQWDWMASSGAGDFVYGELCIPSKSTIAGLGEPCNMWAQSPSAACGISGVCMKCPEVWNSVYKNATCFAFNSRARANSGTTCPAHYTCGYKAKCVMFSGIPACTCAAGYNLDENMIDCYGWDVSNTTECSATCGGYGVQTQYRVCDALPESTAKCSGLPNVTVPCSPVPPSCPLSLNLTNVAVLIQVQTLVVTVSLFDTYLSSDLKFLLVTEINAVCATDKKIFEEQCCRGKTFVATNKTLDCVNPTTGVSFLGQYSDGKSFQFYLITIGDPKSVCCSTAPTASAGKRRKRDISSDNAFDQIILAGILSESPTLLPQMTSLVQRYDPNANVRATVSLATTSTTTSTTTMTTTSTSTTTARAVDDGTIGGIAVWLVGVIAGIGGLVFVFAIAALVVFCIVRNSQYRKRNKVGPTLDAKDKHAVETMMMEKMATTGQHQAQNAGFANNDGEFGAQHLHMAAESMMRPPTAGVQFGAGNPNDPNHPHYPVYNAFINGQYNPDVNNQPLFNVNNNNNNGGPYPPQQMMAGYGIGNNVY